MDVRNCKRCGKIFQYRGNPVCNSCILKDDEDFRKVRSYIIEHPNSTTIEISEATEVELKTIIRFLREGRLEAENFDVGDAGLECEKCGRPINNGRFCEACINELQTGFNAAARQLGAGLDGLEKAKPRGQEKATLHTYENILNKRK